MTVYTLCIRNSGVWKVIQSERLIPFVCVFVETNSSGVTGIRSYELKYINVRRHLLDGVFYRVAAEEKVQESVIRHLIRKSGISPAPEQLVHKTKYQRK